MLLENSVDPEQLASSSTLLSKIIKFGNRYAHCSLIGLNTIFIYT